MRYQSLRIVAVYYRKEVFMKYLDVLKKAVTSEFTTSITLHAILLSLVVGFIISLFIVYIYRKTFTGVSFSKNFALLIILVTMVTAIVIRTISSNLALSLGMVGALSIVRFRTAVKDPIDTGFIFWAISAGIMTGVGMYVIALVTALALGGLFLLSYMFGFAPSGKYLLILRFDPLVKGTVNQYLKKGPKLELRSRQATAARIELTYDIDYSDKVDSWLDQLKNIEGVESVNLVSYQQDFGQ